MNYLGELKFKNQLEGKKSNPVWLQILKVNGNDVTFDTGVQVNIIPKREILKFIEKPMLKKCKLSLLDYSDNVVAIIGEYFLSFKT